VAEQYVCAISGVSAPGVEDDGESGVPVGWATVTIGVRRENPDWNEMMQARNLLVEQQLAALPEDRREEARPLASVMAKATFAALESATPRYIVEETEIHVSEEQLPSFLEFVGESDEE
jgi:hypothetical protein